MHVPDVDNVWRYAHRKQYLFRMKQHKSNMTFVKNVVSASLNVL